MRIEPLGIPEVLLLTPKRNGDERGWLAEVYNTRVLAEAGVNDVFVQDNQAFSSKVGTMRGLHLQVAPKAISKLVRCIRGAVFDVAVDVRPGSPTYGQWAGAELTPDNGALLYVPRGFAHGYVTLQPDTELHYKLDGYWAPDCERGVRWDDPAIGIPWPMPTGDMTLNDRDRTLPLLADFPPAQF
jgi:dTDP-4-dehydrorhamnose 3,5-epimerase